MPGSSKSRCKVSEVGRRPMSKRRLNHTHVADEGRQERGGEVTLERGVAARPVGPAGAREEFLL